MPWDVFLRADQWRMIVAELQCLDSEFYDPRAATKIATPSNGLEPHHVLRLTISDD